MSLISILLVATAILTVSSGLLSLFGVSKQDKGRAVWLLLSNIGAVIWAVSIGLFLALSPTTSDQFAKIVIVGIYLGAMIMSSALL